MTELMPEQTLFERFRRCVRYKQAPFWRKLLLSPARFINNQRRYRWGGVPRGEVSAVRAFHLSRFAIVNGEAVSECIAAYGVYEEELTGAFLRLIRPGQVVVDIGMHLGYYTTLFARLVGEAGAVHAFEPTPSTRAIADRNVARFPQVQVHPFAVWHRAETLSFNDYGPTWMAFNSFTNARMEEGPPSPSRFDAPTVTLDSVRQRLKRRIDLVKIDAESAEERILEGAREVLRSDQPLVTLEVGDVGEDRRSRRLIDLMSGLGYAAWEVGGTKLIPHRPRERYSYGNLIFAPIARDLAREPGA
jgi:FkbM family methyltransferase